MITYEQWNKAIISYFFEDSEPSQIVFLQTNAEMLSEIADVKLSDFNIVGAAASLTEVVREKVVYRDSVNLWTVDPPTPGNLWAEFSEREPPQVAFLALMVLAASMMETSEDVLHTNYYVPLNQLLFGEQRKGCPAGIYLRQIEKFWKHLQLWVEDQYHIELYLTEGASNRRYVWYPISQCLISKRHQRIIYCFFRDRGLTPFSRISNDQLERDLRTWLRRSTGYPRIERYFSNESYKKSILSQVKSLLEHWDSEVPPEPTTYGERQWTARIDIELRFDSNNNVEIRYWFRRRGKDRIDFKTNSLGIQHLQSSHLEKWFQPVIDSSSTFWNLRDSLQLRTDEANSMIYTLGFSDIWVFREDPERDNSWLSQRNMQLHEDHLIVFRKEFADQIMDCLRKTCGHEIEKPSFIYVDSRENNWLYLRGTPIASSSFSDPRLWRLSVVSGRRISLVGGLSVTDRNDHRAYLDICLPAICVPDLGLSDQEPLYIGDQPFPIGKDRLVTLEDTLEPGFYQLIYGQQKRELRVISPSRSLEHRGRTLIASISQNQAAMLTYSMEDIAEVSDKFGLWLTGAKFLGTDIPKVTWNDVQEIPEPSKAENNRSFKTPANIISSVVKMAIDFKQGKTAVPEWFSETIEYLDQNVALRAYVEKKLNLYRKAALSYAELRKRASK